MQRASTWHTFKVDVPVCEETRRHTGIRLQSACSTAQHKLRARLGTGVAESGLVFAGRWNLNLPCRRTWASPAHSLLRHNRSLELRVRRVRADDPGRRIGSYAKSAEESCSCRFYKTS